MKWLISGIKMFRYDKINATEIVKEVYIEPLTRELVKRFYIRFLLDGGYSIEVYAGKNLTPEKMKTIINHIENEPGPYIDVEEIIEDVMKQE